MSIAIEILQKYWGFSSFRNPQDKIIETVLNQKNTIALLPTGGGKSICFQIPALAKNGICIVISPLIALMQDQVKNLQKRGIKATAIPSGTSQNDLIILFDNLKFVTPDHIQEIAVSVIAHRLMLDPQSKFSGKTASIIVEDIIKSIPVPV